MILRTNKQTGFVLWDAGPIAAQDTLKLLLCVGITRNEVMGIIYHLDTSIKMDPKISNRNANISYVILLDFSFLVSSPSGKRPSYTSLAYLWL